MTHARPMKMSAIDILRENALQLALYLLGALLAGLAWWPLAPLYLAYCALSNWLYMAWVCPYCGHYQLHTCPAGFDILSGGRFTKQPGKTFGSEFRRNVYVLVPGWVLPLLAGLYLLWRDFFWPVLGLLVAFGVIGFWWLPESSKKHCQGCETVDCPRRPRQ